MALNATTSLQGQGIRCEPVLRKDYIFFMIINIMLILLNAVIILAVGKARNMLRHNYVYVYVFSTLAANIMLGSCALTVVASDYAGSMDHHRRVNFSIPSDRRIMLLWSFRNSVTISVFLIMCGNIAGLAYRLRDSSCFVGRCMRRTFISQPLLHTPSSHSQRLKAAIIIASVWLLPILFSLYPPLSGKCVHHCQCKPASYIVSICETDKYQECSSSWNPVPKNFLICILIVWIILLLCICYILINIISILLNSNSIHQERRQSNDGERESIRARWSTAWKKTVTYNPSLKLLLLITGCFTIFTFPGVLIAFLDVSSPIINDIPIVVVKLCYMLGVIYAFVSPIIMVKYMPGLRTALIQLFQNVLRYDVKTSSNETQE